MAAERWTLRLEPAAVGVAAIAASFGGTYLLCRWCHAQPGPAILAAVLALSLWRRVPHRQPARGAAWLAVPGVLTATALVAAGIGALFSRSLVLGACAFTAGMALSVWLRNFGERGRRAGALLALPLAAILIAPARAEAPGGPAIDLALVIAAGVCAYVCVAVGTLAARPRAAKVKMLSNAAPRRPGLSASTRLALQMAVALGLAFAAGGVLFPAHWAWCVFTAFIVASGARSRGDAAYKGILRFAGALGGTLAAGLLTNFAHPDGPLAAGAIFVILFAGLLLRDVSYAYWAACMTLVLALIATPQGSTSGYLGVRIEAIVVGAVCAVAAAWFVLPIKVEAIIRRRLADALLALDDFAASAHVSETERNDKLAILEHRMAELEQVTPPARWHRRIFPHTGGSSHPASWVDLAHSVHARARTLDTDYTRDERRRAAMQRAIGASRRAIAAHGKSDPPPGALSVSAALQRLHDGLPAIRSARSR